MSSSLLQTTALVWGGVGLFCGFEAYRGNSKFYSNILMPQLHALCSPENAHKLAVKFLRLGWVPLDKSEDDPCLKSRVFNKTFRNPIGIAAGFDKHAQAMKGLGRIGFGSVEVGSVTPLPQDGNAKPRVFRLPEDFAVINRYGFNSCGHEEAAKRLEQYTSNSRNIVLGINLGKNKSSQHSSDDFVRGVEKLGAFADYLVVNVSSPNTPGLRKLQGKKHLEDICEAVLNARNKLSNHPAVLIKISPDLSSEDRKDVAQVLLEKCVDGMIVSNTTIQRSEFLLNKNKNEIGGLSGEPLREMSTKLIREMYQHTGGKIPIIGVGGISNGEDAYEKIRAGASLVQIYTALIYKGPPLVSAIKAELLYLLKRDGFCNITEAVGVDVK